jgi:hypothetical protein
MDEPTIPHGALSPFALDRLPRTGWLHWNSLRSQGIRGRLRNRVAPHSVGHRRPAPSTPNAWHYGRFGVEGGD